ncbi:MAG: hypothetical protein Kow0077_19200 [Anaerolineae bacterium]
MGRWGLRQVATLCVLVWIIAACGPMLPALPLDTPTPTDVPLIIRTASPPSGGSPTPATAQPSPGTTQEASRPRPTAEITPRPVSTPVYYTVVEGDTLPRIAEQFGLSLEALRAANGDLPLDAIHPGQVLLIPLEVARPTGTFVRYLPTSTPLAIALPQPACTPSPTGEVLCLGLIPNPTSGPISNLVVEVSLQDADGRALARHTVSPTLRVLPAGSRIGYIARFPNAPAYDHAAVSLLDAQPVTNAEYPVRPLTTVWQRVEQENNLVRVRGELRHDGEAPLDDLVVTALLLDEEGRVTGIRVERPVIRLAPGESYLVDMLLIPVGGRAPAEVLLMGEGLQRAADPPRR